jgi:hypothetical protein
LAKKKEIKTADSRVKIRDSLILLSRKCCVKEENDKWIITGELPKLRKKTHTKQRISKQIIF